jgi:hypothetical protein
VPQRVEPAQRREFNPNKDSVEDLDTFAYLEHVEKITDSEALPSPHPLPRTKTYPGAGAPMSDYIPGLWERDAHGSLETNLHNNPNYPFATCKEYKYIHSGIKKNVMKTYYVIMLKEENTALRSQASKTEKAFRSSWLA